MLSLPACQQTAPAPAPPKEINLLGSLERRSTTTVHTSSPTTTESNGKVIVNALGMRMLVVEPGTFQRGSPPHEAGRLQDEISYEVRLTQRFYMSATEVTQQQWHQIMRTQPWVAQRDAVVGQDQPATHMTHAEARQFCVLLSRVENANYRLPTEAEWEYVCRAGSGGPFGVSGSLEEHAWTAENAPRRHAEPVGRKKANAWGFFDMHGNVAEWCGDWYGPYPRSATTDPTGPAVGEYRVARGGSYDVSPRFSRAAYRAGMDEHTRGGNLGLRVVLIR